MTAPVGFSLAKAKATGDVEVHGRTIPRGSPSVLASRSVGIYPDVVPDPDVFGPNRWFRPGVEERRGMPAEILDHRLYRVPFSTGARKCPGSRVANHEAKIFPSQLVLDRKISIADATGDREQRRQRPESWRDIGDDMGLSIRPERLPVSGNSVV